MGFVLKTVFAFALFSHPSFAIIINITDDSIELPVNISIPDDELTICTSLRFGEKIAAIKLFGEFGDNLCLWIRYEGGYGFVGIKNVYYIFLLPEDFGIQPLTWTNLCFSSNATHYHLFGQGRLWYENERSNYKTLKGLNLEKISFRQFEAKSNVDLKVSKLNVWSTYMNPIQLEKISKECNPESEGDLIGWTKITGHLKSLSTISINDQNDDKICNSFIGKIIQPFSVQIDFDSMQKACQKLGGQVYFPGWDYESYVELPFESFNQTLCKRPESWTPLKKVGNHDYHIVSTKEDLPFSKDWPWHQRFESPNGGSEQECISMDHEGMEDKPCNLEMCSFCELKENIAFSLRGLCEESELDDQYLLIPSADLVNNFVTFQGFSQSNIQMTNNGWEIKSKIDGKKLGRLQSSAPDRLPIGKYEWELHDPKCNGSRWLKLSKCDSESFSCDNGQCIDLYKVCDLYGDCEDKSDEAHDVCKTVMFEAGGYEKLRPPLKKTKVEVQIEVLKLGQINEVEGSFKCKFDVILKWIDSRLRYKFIHGYNSVLYRKSSEEIWLPDLYIIDTIGAPNDLISKYQVQIQHGGPPQKANRRNLHEALVYEGNENPLVFSEILDESLSCDFELTYYPFDTQTCSILLRVPILKRSVIDLVPGKCESLEKITLAQYIILGMVNRVGGRHNDTMVCDIILKRNPAFHIVATYLPTLTLMITALATLFIDEGHVEATIMVAMTSMLVMFTLHQNVQSKVPYTAYLKFVDYWLIYGTILPFVVFIVEVGWELGLGDKQSQNKVRRITSRIEEKPKRNLFKVIPKYGLPFVTFVFVTAYTTIALYIQLQ